MSTAFFKLWRCSPAEIVRYPEISPTTICRLPLMSNIFPHQTPWHWRPFFVESHSAPLTTKNRSKWNMSNTIPIPWFLVWRNRKSVTPILSIARPCDTIDRMLWRHNRPFSPMQLTIISFWHPHMCVVNFQKAFTNACHPRRCPYFKCGFM